MALNYPMTRYRPSRSQDGEGGWIETLPSTGYQFFGVVRVHQNVTSILVDWYEDIIVSDFIAVSDDDGPEAFYRVTDRARLLGVPRAELAVERVERPISAHAFYLVSAGGHRLVSAGGHSLVAAD